LKKQKEKENRTLWHGRHKNGYDDAKCVTPFKQIRKIRAKINANVGVAGETKRNG